MKTFLNKSWKFILDVVRWAPIAAAVIFIILFLYPVPWTGFGDYTTPNGEFVRGKTLWDWMELLVIPFFLWAGAVAVNRSERELERQRAEDHAKLEREITTDRQQENILQSYLDRMSDLLLNKDLRVSMDEELRNVARTRTLTVLRILDGVRKGVVIQFLYEAGLIGKEKTVVELKGADLSYVDLRSADISRSNLRGAKLHFARLKWSVMEEVELSYADMENAEINGASLKGAILDNANLYHVNLQVADLENADLRGANLVDADFSEANLKRAKLEFAFLFKANLQGANLESANLRNARLGHEQLSMAKSLNGATMPDGTIHE